MHVHEVTSREVLEASMASIRSRPILGREIHHWTPALTFWCFVAVLPILNLILILYLWLLN
jgi:hypothetical protein